MSVFNANDYIAAFGGHTPLEAIYCRGEKIWPLKQPDYLKFVSNGTAKVHLNNVGGNNPNCEYSVDGGTTWNAMPTSAGAAVTIPSETYGGMLVRGNNPSGFCSGWDYSTFMFSGSPVAASGNISSLQDNVGSETVMKGRMERVFLNQSLLTSAPNLNFTTLNADGYNNMFSGCTALTETPALPATAVPNQAYMDMFSGCTSLATITPFNVTSVGERGMREMFANCTSLTDASVLALPAEDDSNREKYGSMFWHCTSLVKAPAINIKKTAQSDYYNMFLDCSALSDISHIVIEATDIKSNSFYSTFKNCTSLTTCIPMTIDTVEYGGCWSMYQNSRITDCSNVIINDTAPHAFRSMFSDNPNLTKAMDSLYGTGDERCYTEMFRWTNIDKAPSFAISVAADHMCQGMFSECHSLVDISGITVTANTLEEGCFQDMFQYDEKITSNAIDLPATVLKPYCCSGMYNGCNLLADSGLIAATDFSAEMCCANMFNSCMKMATLPDMEINKVGNMCFANMFYNCASVVDGSNVCVNCEESAYACCMRMFNWCQSLEVPPVVKFTKWADSAGLGMFQDDNHLTTAPEIHVDELKGEYALKAMFMNCHFITDYNTKVHLDTTELTKGCYQSLFEGCSSMVVAPDFPAETLVEECYSDMLSGCSSLKEVRCYAKDINALNCTFHMMYNTSQDSVERIFWGVPELDPEGDGATKWQRGANGVQNAWIYCCNYVDVWYDVTDVTAPTKIADNHTRIVRMDVDDTATSKDDLLAPATTYQFDVPGIHKVRWWFAGDQLYPKIEENADYRGNFQEVAAVHTFEMSNGCTKLGKWFQGSGLRYFDAPSIKRTGDWALRYCNNLTTDIELPNCEFIAGSTFTNTPVTKVTLPAVKTFGGKVSDPAVFSNCPNLTTVDIGPNVETLGGYMFHQEGRNEIIRNIIIRAVTPPTVDPPGHTPFGYWGFHGDAIYVPDEAVDAYKALPNSYWGGSGTPDMAQFIKPLSSYTG